MKKEILGKCMLLMSALIWGSSFIVMKNAVDFISPFTLLCIRFVLSTIFISILFFNKIKKIKKQDLLGGFLAGLALFSAFSIQTFGLQLTTPGKNAFLTAVYCTIVPLLSWLYFKKKPDKAQIFAAILCFIGVGFVSLDSSLKVNLGDLYTLIGGFLYAVHIIVCEKAMKKTSPIIITALQFAFASIFSFIAASLFEDISVVFHIDSSIYLQILYLAFFATTLCYLFQNVGQKFVNENIAALLLSLESVFGVFFSILFGQEIMTLQIGLGFMIIFISVLISETKLSFLHRGRKTMIKKLFTITLSLMMIFTSFVPVFAEGEEVNIVGQYGIVIDKDTGQVLYNKNAHDKMYPASITKILTCIVAIEMLDDLDKTSTITQSDIDTVWETGATSADFTVGEVVTYRDMLMGAMLPSGADACRALANNTCGSQEKFVEKMNQLVKKLGLKDSHFVNTTGIHDDDHYTTAYDMAKITQYALKNKKFVEVFDRYQYTSSDGQHQWVKKVIYKSKRDHIDTSMIEGCKSGYTSKAQSTLSSLLNINDHHYVCVVGFSKNSDGYNHCTVNDTLALGNYVKDHYSVANIIKKDTKMNSVKIKNGQTNKVDVITEKDIEAVLPNNYNPSDIKYKYHLKDLTAPVKKDQKAGTMDVYYRDTKLETISLNTTQAVDESGSVVFMRKMKNVVLPCVMAVVIILVVLLLVRKIMIKQRRKKRCQQRNRKK